MLLLLVVGLLTTTAATTPQSDYRQARALYDRGDWNGLAELTEKALHDPTTNSADDVVRLRILRGAANLTRNSKLAAECVTPELPAHLQTSDIAVIRLRILGTLAYFENRDADAAARLEEARKLAVARHPRLVAETLVPRTNMRRIYSVSACESYAKEAIRYAVRYKETRSEIAARGVLARVYGLEERYDEAVAAGEQVLLLAKASHNQSLQQSILGNLGWFCEELGDDERAEQYLREALALAAQLGIKRDIAPWRLQLGNIAVAREDYATAEKEYREGLAAATQFSPDRRGAALADLAAVAIETHRYEEARRYNADAQSAKREEKDTKGLERSQILEARIDRETNQLDVAKREVEGVIAATKSHFVRLEAETELARVCAARGESDDAERHFHDASDLMGAARAEITSPELRLPFASVSASLNHDYVDFLASAGRSRDALQVVEQSRARTLAEGLGQREGAGDFDPEGLAKRTNVTVLSYWLGPQRSFLFVITPQRVQHIVLPGSKAINEAVDAYQRDLNNTRRGAELYMMLIAPAAAVIRGNRIAIIPDGRLAAFNFETLVTPERHFWIQDVTIESAPALEFVAGPRKAPRGRMLLVGNALQADPQYPPLPHAAEEIASIEKYFDQHTTLAGPRATPLAYTKAGPESYAYVHFVAHGVAARQRPLDSAVILGRDANGYKLYARDVMAHPLKARLVTISSCHGAGRRAFAGEGLVGLAWAFLWAGSHEVVAALWEVNDASTVRLMDAMYAGIHSGQPPADALRAAKLKLLDRKDIWRKPQYWAPFVLYSGS